MKNPENQDRTPGCHSRPFKASLLFLLITLTYTLKSQNPQDTIRIQAINFNLLQELILKGIDSTRISNGRKPLAIDSSLIAAAADQAFYLAKQRSISHRQPIPLKETVQKRAEYFGGIHFLCGENIAASYVSELIAAKNGKTYRNITYQQLAGDFVGLWNNSPPHYQNIINPYYSHSGLALSLNPNSKRVVAVQVFGYLKKE